MNLNNEANLQAEFYHQCRLIGLRCHLEVVTPAGRLDCVILDQEGSMFLAIIEVKPESVLSHQHQINRYKALGVPVFLLNPSACPRSLALHILTTCITGVPIQTIDSMTHLRLDRLQAKAQRKTDRLQRQLYPWTN